MNINEFFNEYASALLSYSPENISAFYQVPLTVYSDNGVQQVSEQQEVMSFWEIGIKQYADLGIIKSIPKIVSDEQLSATIHIAKVLWINYDINDKEIARETNFYILSEWEDTFRIRGLIIMT